jgi:acyl-CoA synthetase (AMP-forming)/AMP-acid ligase II
MTDWNLADVFETVAECVPDAPCQIHGEREFTWRQFDGRANALAADLLAAGLSHQSKVAAYLYNGPEYLETYFAAFKAGLAPVNTNFRYTAEELLYLWDNADAEAVVFHAVFTPHVEALRDRLPGVKRWYAVPDGHPLPDWAVDYEAVVAGDPERTVAPWGRSGDDLLLLYTGGTTGMPKGVMWRQDDLFQVLGAGGNELLGWEPYASLGDIRTQLSEPGRRFLPACPLMHGTGQFSAFINLFRGGCVACLPSRHFDANELWDEVARLGLNNIAIVGDAFARPMLRALQDHPGRWNLESVTTISSSGVMWSQEIKAGLLEHIPQVLLIDSLGSSEAVGLGASASTKDEKPGTAKFQLGETVRVFTDDDRPVEPGSGERGRVAISGFLPAGYYKDPEKTAKTFRTIDGVRYSIPGDYATVEADGSITLLGRGSVCINTGGEKVFPEEVEEVLKTHPAVHDAVCVGIPHERFGEAVFAWVEPEPKGPAVDEVDVIEHVRQHLAAYKAPRHVRTIDSIGRAPNGKVDYKTLKARALEALG